MRNRKMQRRMRRTYGKEEKLDLVDCFGIKDPTPYKAVMNLIKQERSLAAGRRMPGVAVREAAVVQ